MNKLKQILTGPSKDSVFLMAARIITIILGMATSRLLSDALSLTEYGTYSQIMLLVSTIASVTILGMADGSNYFYYNNQGEKERAEYISTIFFLQYMFSFLAGSILLMISRQLTVYFGNEKIRGLLIFAAVIPLLQNMISILQVLFIAVGKAKQIAVRNFIFSFIRLILFAAACHIIHNITAIFIFMILMDLAQIVYFRAVLNKNHCNIGITKINLKLIKNILTYCIPMAVFIIVSSLSRDCDKYVISAYTDTNTLAIYSNASKMLPFDIIYSSFCTVLVPYITKYISNGLYVEAQKLYRKFLELAIMTTSILACAAIVSAPMLLELLYTKKYMEGLWIFIVYILVDIVRVLNITIVLSAVGQAKELVMISGISLALNFVLNIIFFKKLGIIGPALSTLLVMTLSGIVIQNKCSKVLQCKLNKLLSAKKILFYGVKLCSVSIIFIVLSEIFSQSTIHYIIRLLIISGGFCMSMLMICGKELIIIIKEIGNYKLN